MVSAKKTTSSTVVVSGIVDVAEFLIALSLKYSDKATAAFGRLLVL